MMLSTCLSSRSGPSMKISISSPRAAHICSLSSWYLGLGDIAASVVCCSRRLGRMPTMASRTPAWRARRSARLYLSVISRSIAASASPASSRGAMLTSMLKRPSSGLQSGSSIAASTSALRMAGEPASSTRLNSTSSPTCSGPSVNRDSRSMRASTSRQLRTFSRYRRRSA